MNLEGLIGNRPYISNSHLMGHERFIWAKQGNSSVCNELNLLCKSVSCSVLCDLSLLLYLMKDVTLRSFGSLSMTGQPL